MVQPLERIAGDNGVRWLAQLDVVVPRLRLGSDPEDVFLQLGETWKECLESRRIEHTELKIAVLPSLDRFPDQFRVFA